MQMMSFMRFIYNKFIDFNHSLFLSFFTKKVVIRLAFQLFSRGNKKYFFLIIDGFKEARCGESGGYKKIVIVPWFSG